MKLLNTFRAAVAATLLLCTTPCFAGSFGGASEDASADISGSALMLTSAAACLSGASVYLSADAVITLGTPIAHTIIDAAEVSGDAVVFSSDVLTEGLVTTGQLSADLTRAGVDFSADSAVFVASAALSGIYISTDTAELFLSQAVNIAAASGRLSGEAAELAVTLAAAGVEISADSTVLIANAGKAGIHLSEDAAQSFIDSSLAIAAECIESAQITERYVLMTVAEANQILKEASINAVQSSIKGGIKTYTFTVETASHLHSLGIDSVKYAKDLTKRAATTTVKAISTSVHGANDAIVVVINTGSGLVVASLDSLTDAVNNTTANIQQ
ncbi:hypothetical protein [Desulforhopalus sp. 52FAK]